MLLPERALISSALNEVHGCSSLYLAAADPCGIKAQLRSKTSPHAWKTEALRPLMESRDAYSVQDGEVSVLLATGVCLSCYVGQE